MPHRKCCTSTSEPGSARGERTSVSVWKLVSRLLLAGSSHFTLLELLWIMNERQREKCVKHRTAWFPACCSMTVDEAKQENLRLQVEAVGSAKQLIHFSLWTVSVSFTLLHQLLYLAKTAKEPLPWKKMLSSVTTVDSLSFFFFLVWRTSMKFNQPVQD